MSPLALKKEIQTIITTSGYGRNPLLFSSIVKVIQMRHKNIDMNLVKQMAYCELNG
jgi:hypothetical protein